MTLYRGTRAPRVCPAGCQTTTAPCLCDPSWRVETPKCTSTDRSRKKNTACIPRRNVSAKVLRAVHDGISSWACGQVREVTAPHPHALFVRQRRDLEAASPNREGKRGSTTPVGEPSRPHLCVAVSGWQGNRRPSSQPTSKSGRFRYHSSPKGAQPWSKPQHLEPESWFVAESGWRAASIRRATPRS